MYESWNLMKPERMADRLENDSQVVFKVYLLKLAQISWFLDVLYKQKVEIFSFLFFGKGIRQTK